ncbi:hypothetical protein [Hungatella hathewayi]|uniref:hypothetical protein n=1 Tax=Hungatella hathewayi TaxID=154046 RepID=UPI0011DD7D51|nr:hypothetical protein [Hungatella hathewayi]
MKKLSALLLAFLMLLSLVACGGGNDTPDTSGSSGSGMSQQQEQPGRTPDENNEQPNPPDGEVDDTNWLDYLTDTYDLAFTDSDHEYWTDYYPVSITENETDEADTSLFKFEDMPMDMQNVLVGYMFTASAALSGNNNLDPASGDVIGNATDDLYFYGDSDPSPTKAWNYTYNNAQYNISIALSSSKYVEMTVTAYRGDATIGGETSAVQAGSFEEPFNDKWPDCGATRLIPRPEFADKNTSTYEEGVLTGTSFVATYGDVTIEQMHDYAEAVKEAGFTDKVKEEGNEMIFNFRAYNADGVEFKLTCNSALGMFLLEMQ